MLIGRVVWYGSCDWSVFSCELGGTVKRAEGDKTELNRALHDAKQRIAGQCSLVA